RRAAQYHRHARDALDIDHGRRAAVEARPTRERRLAPRLALLALEALEHRRLFAAAVGAGAALDAPIAVVAGASSILGDHARLIAVGKAAPPRPRRPGALIRSMIVSWPMAISALVSAQSPRCFAAFRNGDWKP